VQRPAVAHFHYELVTEDGEAIGGIESEDGAPAVGDMIPCGGHMFEISRVDDGTLHVRRVI
jgi:hypothetical protein